MRKFIVLPLLLLLLSVSGCLRQEPQPAAQAMPSFAREDEYIMYALDAEVNQHYADASRYYDILYRNTHNKEYLYRSVMMLLDNGDTDAVIARTTRYLKQETAPLPQLMRFKIAALMKQDRLEEAKQLALELLAITKAEGDYLLVSKIYQKEEHYNMAIKYLESAYAIAYDEKILDRLAVTLYVNLDRKEDAISYLETHNRLHGCSQVVCSRLAGFYSNQNNIEGMLSIYLRMYENHKDPRVAEAIINIYRYKQEFSKLMMFLEKYHVNDKMLLQLYVNSRHYKKAALLAKKIYEDSGESSFLGQSAIFEYEASSDKENPKVLHRVMHILKEVILQNEDPLFLNYLGYLMIDHNLGVEEGVSYVKRALKIEPESSFYLDSLAWGYYKLHRCQEAYELMQKVMTTLGSDDEEVQEHIRAIEQCLKDMK
ncbi:MAG: hypothetical protein DSZ03_07095 [Sulfurimonas sp.]|nr:MAG: hypothetical protein DSZ03_07095 [Sulfurimonas sp.]